MDKKALIAGMDEAGRGPAIGPLVIAIVVLTEDQIDILEERGVNDSKKISPKRREKFRKIIQENAELIATKIYQAEDINKMMEKGINLNEIEVRGYRELLRENSNGLSEVYLDAADVKAERFGKKVCAGLTGIACVSEHRADGKYTVVGAASIIAKTTRDHLITNLREQYLKEYPDIPSFKSGYPTDSKPFLDEFYRRYRAFPQIARVKWKTCTAIEKKYKSVQKNLDEFF